nr:hypothetical protein PB20LOC_02337 [Pectobacterium parmentieri]
MKEAQIELSDLIFYVHCDSLVINTIMRVILRIDTNIVILIPSHTLPLAQLSCNLPLLKPEIIGLLLHGCSYF